MKANHTLCRHGRVTELGCIALQAVQKSHDGKDNHTCVHCSEVGFIVILISGMFQVELTLVSASSCLHWDMATTVGLLLSTWSAFVMNRCKFASAVFAWGFYLLKNWNNWSLFALLSILRSFCHFAPLSWGILDEISVCHPAVSPQLVGLRLETFHPTCIENCIHSSAG